MSHIDSSSAFNLIEEDWIPVLRANGRFERVGIRRALSEAGLIRQIAASNPMDNVALLRFLIAVLLWCRPDLSENDRQGLRDANGISANWLKKLDENVAAFNLLGDGERFYQDVCVKDKEPRPIADVLVEFPGADSVNHMRHIVHDGTYGFCPACCALGILRLSVWAPANRFYPASVNPGSAAYAFAEGGALLLTLVANLPGASACAVRAPWLTQTPPESPDAVAKLAWRPRQVWLNVSAETGRCANCDRFGVLVASLCNEGGWATPTTDGRTKKFWDADPLLLRDDEPISLPGLGATAAAHASRFWRAAFRLRGARTGKVVAIGPVVNKFIFQDATSVGLPSAAAQTRADLSSECSDELRGLRRRVTPNPDRQHPEINSAFVLMTPDTEARIRALLDDPVAATDDSGFLNEVYQPLVEQVIASTVRGSPLRRREAMTRARSALDDAIRKATAPPKPAAGGDKPKRTRKKKGGDT